MRRLAEHAVVSCAMAGVLALPCFAAPDPPKKDKKDALKEEGQKVFSPAPPAKTESESEQEARTTEGWTIVLAVYRESKDENSVAVVAQETLVKVQTEGQLPEAFLTRRGPAMVIALGDFASAEDKAAQAELKRIQSLQVGLEKPYGAAFLAPPMNTTVKVGTMPEYNLLKSHETHADLAKYTLQVGAYGRQDLAKPTEADLAEARKAAEKAALTLRQEGELAFYYHGRSLSMVTVGVFSDDDVDAEGFVSTSIRETKKRHPYNLYNGAAIRQRVPGQARAVLQASQLVAIPEK